MIIDIHTHTFPDKIAAQAIEKLSHASHTVPFTDGTSKGLLIAAQSEGIDLSVILPVASSPRQVSHINEASAALNSIYKGRGLFSIGCMHPDYEDYRQELKKIRDLGLKGIKIHPVYQDRDLDDIRYLRIFDAAASLGLFVITHAGLDIGYEGVKRCTPSMCRYVSQKIDGLTLILAHMGGWLNWDEVPEKLADTSVLLDTSFSTGKAYPADDHWAHGFSLLESEGLWKNDVKMLSQDQFMKLYNAFGCERILFGTDSPWSRQSEVLGFLRALPIPSNALHKILGGNAEALLFGHDLPKSHIPD